MKICSKCKEEKNKNEFYCDKRASDGLHSQCKKCKIADGKNRKDYQKKYRDSHKEFNKEYKKNYQQINKEKIKKKKEKYYCDNKELINDKIQNRKKSDPLFKLSGDIRSLICITLRNGGWKKYSKTANILGCTFEEFYAHIEKQFTEGMSWDNRELWHLDHIYPVSRALNEEHLLQLNHYTNFQPLWARDNIIKGNKLPEELL